MPTSKSEKIVHSQREQFFSKLKGKYPNLYAIYFMTSTLFIWSGTWYFVDTWAKGLDLMAPAGEISLWIPIRHFSILLVGLLMLYIDDKSLQELVLMKKTAPAKNFESKSSHKRVFYHLKTRYPNLMSVYTVFAIILSWCGTWGLIWDIPILPFWRSLLTISIGFFLLYIDDLKLDEI
jgi:hypothetical protein